jgi:hypothetical protein
VGKIFGVEDKKPRFGAWNSKLRVGKLQLGGVNSKFRA